MAARHAIRLAVLPLVMILGPGGGAVRTGEVTGDITVFAAASLTESFEEIGAAFEEANPDADVTFNFAASSSLVAQIAEGAPVDVFASADQDNMEKLIDADRNAGDPVTFATNALAIIVEPGNPQGISGVEDLADPALIVVTTDRAVPIGAYTEQVFEAAGVEVTPDSFEENVRGIVSKVIAGEADAGVVYVTDVISAGDDADGVAIPDDINVVAQFPIAPLAEAPNPSGGEAFVEFVLGGAGQAILADLGFGSPEVVSAPSTAPSTSEG